MDTKTHQLFSLFTNFNTVYVVGLTWSPEEATAMVTIETTDIETALSQSLLEVTVMGSGLA